MISNIGQNTNNRSSHVCYNNNHQTFFLVFSVDHVITSYPILNIPSKKNYGVIRAQILSYNFYLYIPLLNSQQNLGHLSVRGISSPLHLKFPISSWFPINLSSVGPCMTYLQYFQSLLMYLDKMTSVTFLFTKKDERDVYLWAKRYGKN